MAKICKSLNTQEGKKFQDNDMNSFALNGKTNPTNVAHLLQEKTRSKVGKTLKLIARCWDFMPELTTGRKSDKSDTEILQN